MKKIFSFLLCLCLLLTVAGCTTQPHTTTSPTTDPVATGDPANVATTAPQVDYTSYQTPLAAISMPTVSNTKTAEDGTLLFTYSYQNVALILQDPEVADRVVIDLLNRIDATRSSADAIAAGVESAYALTKDWTPYFYQIHYNPMRIDQGVLSLFGSEVSFNGSAHPSNLAISANYDLVTGKSLVFGDILSHDYSATQLCQLIIDALEPQAESLYSDYAQIVTERFSGDISYVEAWYFSLDGLCLYFSPYDVGPYSSGTIVAEIPYETLNGILKDDYFPAERANYAGVMDAQLFENADLEQYTQFAELTLDRDGVNILLYPDGMVCDVRIEQGSWSNDMSTFIPEKTVFAAGSLEEGDAVMVETSFSDGAPNLRLTYHTGDRDISVFITQNGEDGSIILTGNV